MDKINELMKRLSELTPDELSELKTSILSEFEALDSQEDRTRETVQLMSDLADANDKITAEESTRVAEAEELTQLANDAANRIKGDSDEEDEGESEESDTEEEEHQTELSTKEEDSEGDKNEDEEEAEEASHEDADKLSADSEETSTELSEETPEEAQLSEAPAEEAELSEATAEETTLSTESVDSEEENNENSLSSHEEPTQESEETTVTSSINPDFQAPAENAPAVEEVVPFKATITAAADIKGFSSGDTMPGMKAVAQAFLDRRKAMGRTSGGDGEQALVASISHADAYSEDRFLDSADFEGNREKIDTVVASIKAPGAITASGGLLGPVETSWDIYELGETLGRPVKNSLPSFTADRGGLRFMTPPVLADLEGAVSVWTLQDDIDAASNDGTATDKVKPSVRVEAGEEVTVYLEAQPLILTFGNIGARAYPELVERHIQLAMVWQARFAESRLLTRIGELSTAVTAAAELGAARDILVQVDTASAALRNRHRLDSEAPLKAIFPLWFKNALRSDLVKQLPGDGQDAAFSLADAKIDRWFSERNINVVWSLDGENGQILGSQGAGALNDFPSNVVWYLFPEGTFLFLEEATIDLGIVRDSTLNATNDYQMFIETFENVAKVGVESLRIESGLKIAGASAGTVNTVA